MYKRILAPLLLESIKKYAVITLLGPRQSGKTTLAKQVFPDYAYYSLEDPDIRLLATSDPRSFLTQAEDKVIFDEIQRVPQLTSYIQTIVDNDLSKTRKFILTGSNGLLLSDSISQTLAGRTDLFKLLPLSSFQMLQRTK